MKIGYFADGPWSHLAFEKIVFDSQLKISFICARFDTTDTQLEKYAQKHNIPFFRHINVNSEDFLNKVREFHCDLFVSMSFNQIFRNQLINIPPKGVINCHAGKLPFYRGRNVLNWVLINDEKEFGITVHYIDESIDTGDIIAQRTYAISDQDDYSTLLARAYVGCAEILYEAVKSIQLGTVERQNQKSIHPDGSYCKMRKTGDEILNWKQSARHVFNFVRAICKPGPQARTFLNGSEIKINKVREVMTLEYKDALPGQVVSTNNGILVKTQDHLIELLEYTALVELQVGDYLL